MFSQIDRIVIFFFFFHFNIIRKKIVECEKRVKKIHAFRMSMLCGATDFSPVDMILHVALQMVSIRGKNAVKFVTEKK